jgi:hypothetical protein
MILNNSLVTVDAVLTTKGRELLARNDGSFQITQFALSDDEIDYTLYNPNHPSGSTFFGEAIEAMPLTEAFPDENQIMKYKLVTLPRGTSKLPVISLGYNSLSIRQGASITFTPQTLNYLGSVSSFESSGYTVTIADVRLVSSFEGTGINNINNNIINSNVSVGAPLSKTVVGTSFTIVGTTINNLFGSANQLSTTLTVIGRDSGSRITIPLNIIKINN